MNPSPRSSVADPSAKKKLITIGAKVETDAKAVTFPRAAGAVPRTLFAAVLDRLGQQRTVPRIG